MPGFGSGLGGFIEGVTKGAALRRQIDSDVSDREISKEKLGFARDANRRAEESHGLAVKAEQARQAEDAANAPLREAERRNKLGLADDANRTAEARRKAVDDATADYEAQKSKSIMNGVDATGRPSFSVEGQSFATSEQAQRRFEQLHGTWGDNYRKKFLPQVEKAMLRAGNLEGAKMWGAWNEGEGVKRGIADVGRVQAAVHIGDWKGATTHANKVLENGGYVPQIGIKISVDPIVEDGKTTGAKVTYTDENNRQTHVKEYKDLGEFGSDFATVANPMQMFQHTKSLYDQAQAEKLKRSEENRKLSNDLIREKVKHDNTLDTKMFEDALKNYSPIDRDTIMKAIPELHKATDGAAFKKREGNRDVQMTPDEMVAATIDFLRKADRGAASPGQPGQPAAPQPRVLMSRPAMPSPDRLGMRLPGYPSVPPVRAPTPSPAQPQGVAPKSILGIFPR